MPRFEPFVGLRYHLPSLSAQGYTLSDVVAPPYDVVDAAERAQLVRRCRFNSIQIELPDASTGPAGYGAAAGLLATWMDQGLLCLDPQASFYRYSMRWEGPEGDLRATTGVLGALEVSPAEAGEVLPHELTTPKARGDRLALLGAARANTSPVWGMAMGTGLSEALDVGAGRPDAAATDGDGVVHELWVVDQPDTAAAIRSVVSSAPVLLADGHHRYETALLYHRSRVDGGLGQDGSDLVLALVVELSEDQLSIGPIHRALGGLPAGYDLAEGLRDSYDLLEAGDAEVSVPESWPLMITRTGTWRMRARPGLVAATPDDLDSSRLDLALADIAPHRLQYHHDPSSVAKLVLEGQADAGVFLRPATVGTIRAAAGEGRRLPAKSTFFTPKPRTGMAFRLLG